MTHSLTAQPWIIASLPSPLAYLALQPNCLTFLTPLLESISRQAKAHFLLPELVAASLCLLSPSEAASFCQRELFNSSFSRRQQWKAFGPSDPAAPDHNSSFHDVVFFPTKSDPCPLSFFIHNFTSFYILLSSFCHWSFRICFNVCDVFIFHTNPPWSL